MLHLAAAHISPAHISLKELSSAFRYIPNPSTLKTFGLIPKLSNLKDGFPAAWDLSLKYSRVARKLSHSVCRLDLLMLGLSQTCFLRLLLKGPYGCLGKQLAIQEIRVLISKLLLTYDLSLPSDFDKVKFAEGIQAWRSTVLKHPLRVVITPRH